MDYPLGALLQDRPRSVSGDDPGHVALRRDDRRLAADGNADKRSAAEFSFFLAMPTMAGAFAYDLYKNRDILSAADLPIIAAGFIAAFIMAVIVVRSLLGYVSRRGYSLFGWWRLIVGGLGLIGLLIWG
jgi:undecaprenyl-diphosphatase